MDRNSQERSDEGIALPDELWASLLDALPGASKGIETSIRLFSGEIIDRLVVSNRGYILGSEAPGLAGYQGVIDKSILTFCRDDIEAVQVPTFHFWQRSKWLPLNPEHPARKGNRTKR